MRFDVVILSLGFIYVFRKRADGYESNFDKTYRIWVECHLREEKTENGRHPTANRSVLTYCICYVRNGNCHIHYRGPGRLFIVTFLSVARIYYVFVNESKLFLRSSEFHTRRLLWWDNVVIRDSILTFPFLATYFNEKIKKKKYEKKYK